MPAIPAPAAAIRPANAKFEWRFRFIEDAWPPKAWRRRRGIGGDGYKRSALTLREIATPNELAKKLHKKIKNHTP